MKIVSVQSSILTFILSIFQGGKMVLLVLNSLYWSPYVGSSADIVDKSKRQLEWLENQLELAKSQEQKVMLAGHIPPG